MQVGVDQTGHDGLAGGVDDLEALRGVLVGAGVGDLAVLDEHERVLDRGPAQSVYELAAHDRVVLAHCSSFSRGRIPSTPACCGLPGGASRIVPKETETDPGQPTTAPARRIRVTGPDAAPRPGDGRERPRGRLRP